MNNLGVVLVKLTVLAGGAVIGALLARWYDEALAGNVLPPPDSPADRAPMKSSLPAAFLLLLFTAPGPAEEGTADQGGTSPPPAGGTR